MPIRTTIRGPLRSPTGARRTVEAELRQATLDGTAFVRSRANSIVNRYLGTYETGWQPTRFEFGGPVILRAVTANTSPHARVQEDGRRAGFWTPLAPIIAWILSRGITPRRGTSEAAYRGFARAIIAKHHARGWPSAGTPNYPNGPRAPVATAIAREDAQIRTTFRQAGARIARRLGG
jgi:hypothetical protein